MRFTKSSMTIHSFHTIKHGKHCVKQMKIQKTSNNVILFYSGDSRSKNRNGGNVGDWNREHTWAKSHGNFGTSKGPGTDIHHLRPTDVQVNSARGNLDFDNGGSAVKGCNGCFKTANSWEPPDNVKGDVARILFYMATRYEKGDKVDLELNEKLNNGSASIPRKTFSTSRMA